MILRAKNWGEFQHYKDRSPAWIKLHRKLLDDRVFHRLPDASRALAPMIWLLCSESEDGTIKDAIAEISFRLRMTEKRVDEALNPLIDAGFFFVEQCASAPLSEPEQPASPEKRREEEETEKEEEIAFSDFVEAARKNGWPTPRAMDAGRRKKLRLRLQEHGVDGWKGMLDRAGKSTFLRTKFALKFDWILEPANFTKVIEGNYDDKAATAVTPTPVGPTADDWKGRVKWHRDKGMWNPNWGPEPGKPGCFVPREFLQ